MDAIKRPESKRRCRRCGCTDDDCRRCITRTGAPCHWVERDLCSACVEKRDMQSGMRIYPSYPIVGQDHGQEGWRR